MCVKVMFSYRRFYVDVCKFSEIFPVERFNA